MARSDLLRQLISSPHPLPPPQPRSLVVAPQAPLPGNLRFGPANPSQTTNSPFSGAVAAGGPLNVVHPETPQNFQSPTYSPLTPVSPVHNVLSALAPILGASLLGGGSGATAPSQPPPPSVGQRTAVPGVSFSPYGPPPAVAQAIGQGAQTATRSTAPAAQNAIGQAALIAALAQRGQRLGGGNTLRF